MEHQEETQIKRKMEQEEEETQIKRRRQQSSSTSSSFPLDLISEILLSLPAKPVGRFRCVSKLWSSVTTDPYFINSFQTRPKSRSPSLLLCFRRGHNLFAFSIPQDHSNEPYSISSQPVVSYHTTYNKYCVFYPKKSVHGLICFQRRTKILIWNPTTKQFLILTKPEKRWKDITVFLGYDPIESKHKLLCLPSDASSDECRVLTLGSAQESWRMVKTNYNHRPVASSSTRECINGVVYYKAFLFGQKEDVIMSFDVRSEKFHAIKLQWENITGNVTLTPYEGRLACVQFSYSGSSVTLWTLEDAEKHDWLCINLPLYISYYEWSLRTTFRFTGITDAGEFVYVPSSFHQSFYVVYYDPKRDSFHSVEFKGIADDQFRLKYEFGDIRLSNIHTVLNHTESLMSCNT